MAVEFVQHDNDSSVRPSLPAIEISRISKDEMQSYKLEEYVSVMKHLYKKGIHKAVLPSVTLNFGPPYELLQKLKNSLQTALEKDTAWLVTLLHKAEGNDFTPEWPDAMAASAKGNDRTKGPATH